MHTPLLASIAIACLAAMLALPESGGLVQAAGLGDAALPDPLDPDGGGAVGGDGPEVVDGPEVGDGPEGGAKKFSFSVPATAAEGFFFNTIAAPVQFLTNLASEKYKKHYIDPPTKSTAKEEAKRIREQVEELHRRKRLGLPSPREEARMKAEKEAAEKEASMTPKEKQEREFDEKVLKVMKQHEAEDARRKKEEDEQPRSLWQKIRHPKRR